ncbi:MAG: response regulator, partial [Desulfobacterales bacterium]|nr:response regulator [Desulfobacterales bacterium]
SVVCKGSTFLLYLPIADKKENTDKENSFKKKIPSGTESILFVDDEKAIRVFVQEFLGNYGYTVTVSENGQKAYERFKQAPKCFDIVITDMTMPKMNGDKLASKILSIRNDIPIILCTGYSEKLNKERAEKIGVTKYIKKPIAGKELCFLIRDVLDESKKADES